MSGSTFPSEPWLPVAQSPVAKAIPDPICIRDAGKTLHFIFPGTPARRLCGVVYWRNNSHTEPYLFISCFRTNVFHIISLDLISCWVILTNESLRSIERRSLPRQRLSRVFCQRDHDSMWLLHQPRLPPEPSNPLQHSGNCALPDFLGWLARS